MRATSLAAVAAREVLKGSGRIGFMGVYKFKAHEKRATEQFGTAVRPA